MKSGKVFRCAIMIFCVGSLGVNLVWAEETFCAVGWNGEFTHISPTSGQIEPTKFILPTKLQALAWSRDGTLYAGKEGALYTIDPYTGNTELVVVVSTSIRGMAFSPSNDLYVTASITFGQQNLRILDIATGDYSDLGALWGDNTASQGLAFSPDGTLYGITANKIQVHELYTIDLDDYEMHLIGSYLMPVNVSQSLTFTPDGSLYAVGDGVFAQLNPDTGAVIGTPISLDGDYRGLAVISGPSAPLAADANGPYTLYVGDTLTLDASGSTDDANDITSYMWDLNDDGIFETDAGTHAIVIVSYAYLESLGLGIGVDNIHLKVTDGDAYADTDSTTLTIEPGIPVADANGPYTLYVGDTLTLDASGSTDNANDITSYMWDLNDDGVFETDPGTQAVFDVSHAYLESLGLGIGVDYNIHLKVTDGDEQADTDTTTLLLVANIASADIFGTGDNQFTIDFVNISGDASSANGTNISRYSPGDSGYKTFTDPDNDYRIGTYEITNDQWNKFSANLGVPVTGSPSNAYEQSAQFTGTNVPTNRLSWLEAAQFVNYLNTDTGHQAAYKFTGIQGTGDYTFSVWESSDTGYDSINPYRNSNAYYFLPTEDEWVKAAYWNGTSLQTYASVGGARPTQSGWNFYDYRYTTDPFGPWDIGTGSEELNGTFDMMGNVQEWMESPYGSGEYLSGSYRVIRGGSYTHYASVLRLSSGYARYPYTAVSTIGFRVASVPKPVMINLDIKPQSCPNPLNVKSKGVFPVAILGTEEFDVYDIDIDSIQLAGVSPIRSNYEDVATPLVDPDECECSTEGPDGYIDLTLKFETQAIADVLGEVYDGEEFILYLTGYLYDGTPIEGSDCIIVRRKGK